MSMSQPPDSSSWLTDGWKVAGAIGTGFVLVIWWLWNQIVARLVTFGTRLDSLERTSVTREELKAMIDGIEDAHERRHRERMEAQEHRHRENLDKFSGLFDQVGKVREDVSRIDGQLSGRYPRIER